MKTRFPVFVLLAAFVAFPLAASASPVAEKFYKEGVKLAKKKRIDDAIGKFQNAVSFEPKTFKYHLNLAYAYEWVDRLPEAQAAYEVAMKLGRNAIQAVSGHAEVCRRLKIYSTAEKSYRKALRKKSKDIKLIMGLAASLAGQDKMDDALKQYKKAIRMSPKDPRPPFKTANILRRQGDLEGAAKYYRKAMEIDPDHSKAEYGLGLVLRAREDYEGAKKALESACKKGVKSACRYYYKIKDK